MSTCGLAAIYILLPARVLSSLHSGRDHYPDTTFGSGQEFTLLQNVDPSIRFMGQSNRTDERISVSVAILPLRAAY